MKIRFLVLFYLFLSWGLKAQVGENMPTTIVEYEGQTFMPDFPGVKEKSVVVAPEISKLRPSPVPLLKKKINNCLTVFYNDTVFNSIKGLKTTFTGTILPPEGLNTFNRRIPSRFEIAIYTTLSRDSLPAWSDMADAWITLHFNNPQKLLGTPVLNDIFVEPLETGMFHGYREFDRVSVPGRVVAVKNNSIRLFEPVTREDFLLSLIAFFQESIDKEEKPDDQTPSSGEAVSAMKYREARHKRFEDHLKEIRKYDPVLAQKLNEAFLEGLSVSATKPEEDQKIKVDKMIVLNTWREGVRKLKAEMNAMSPVERKSQAWWSTNEDSNVSGLTPAGFSGSRPLVRLNRNLIDKTKPNTAIQLIVIEYPVLSDMEIPETSGYNMACSKLLQLMGNEPLWNKAFSLSDP